MTTSSAHSSAPGTAFVWIWLPGETEPVVAGRLDAVGATYVFTYGRSYLARRGAIPLYVPELPLQPGRQRPNPDLDIAGCLADAGPDSWGQRVILARKLGHLDRNSDTGDLDRLTYFLESGSDRIGALDFQVSATTYVPRAAARSPDLNELLTAADRLQDGVPLSDDLADALIRATSIGGARPKALLDDGDTGLIGKFSTTTDTYPVVKAEGVAMDLARRVGLQVPGTRVVETMGRSVLLVDRFDRTPAGGRRVMVSVLTMLGLSEMSGRYATYPELADVIRARFTEPADTLRELFGRIVFSIAVGNIDDHARNHAAFWDGTSMTLTPAYDLCPQPRSGNEVNQAMAIGRSGERQSRFSVCRAAASEYLLSAEEADEVIDRTKQVINDQWTDAADAALLTELERQQLWHRQILNESIEY